MKIAIITKGKMAQLVNRYLLETPEYYGAEISQYLVEDNFVPSDELLMIATGDMALRRKLWEQYKSYPFINVLRTTTPPEKIGKGNFIFPNVYCEWFSEVGNNNIISAGTIINHHCKIGDSNLLGPGCLLSGSVTIGSNCTIGSGVIFQPDTKVKDGTTIPSGTVVVGNLEGRIITKRIGAILTGEYLYSRH
jgi:UDP-3-O-[3-hydroxymyristoyl] glucosamine N-acyltransferase